MAHEYNKVRDEYISVEYFDQEQLDYTSKKSLDEKLDKMKLRYEIILN